MPEPITAALTYEEIHSWLTDMGVELPELNSALEEGHDQARLYLTTQTIIVTVTPPREPVDV